MLKKLAVIAALLAVPFALSAQENKVSIVALVITTAEYSPGSDNILETLDALNAQTLQAQAPNASEMRSILKRFAAAALDNDVALVFADGPIVELGERDFFAPADLNLRRGSDLLTQAIPLSALARATALSANGGAVFVHSADLGIILPDGVKLARIAPTHRTGTSPILIGQSGSFLVMAEIFDRLSQDDAPELNNILAKLTERVEFSVSNIPSRTVLLRNVPMVEPSTESQPVEADEPSGDIREDTPVEVDENGFELPQIGVGENVAPVAEQPETVEETTIEADKPLSLDSLQALENGLTKSEKRSIQRGLRDLGHYNGLIDGIFGRQTTASIEQFQTSIGAEATGVLTVPQLREFAN